MSPDDGAPRNRARMPGPVQRVWRQPMRIAAIVLLGATAVGASGIQSAASATLQATLDAHWRGDYDILVTSASGVGEVDGVLPPNTLAGSPGGMSLDDLARVRAVPGVEVAAPLGEVLVPGLKTRPLTLAVPKHLPGVSVLPQSYRITATYTTDDGLGERVVWSRSRPIVVDETRGAATSDPVPGCGAPGESMAFDDYSFTPADYPALAAAVCSSTASSGNGVTTVDPEGWTFQNDVVGTKVLPSYPLVLPAATISATRVALVDPAAEKALLGDRGSFLDPLVALSPSADTDVDTMSAWAAGDRSAFATRFQAEQQQRAGFMSDRYPPAALDDLRRLWAANDDDFDAWVAAQAVGAPVVPMIVSEAAPATLTVKVDIDGYGSAYPRTVTDDVLRRYMLPMSMRKGAPGTRIGTVTADASGVLNPFQTGAEVVAWPGSDPAAAATLGDQVSPLIGAVGRAAADPYTVDADGIALEAKGYRDAIDQHGDDPFPLNASPEKIGVEAAYQSVDPLWTSDGAAVPPLAVAVGSFDPSKAADGADGVPLGAYDDDGIVVASGAHAGARMKPSVTGTGLVGTRTAAVAAIQSAALWHDDTPVDSIRVRVAGLTGYGPDGQRRVIEVARAIEALGLKPVIVAGSSLTDVDFRVDGYAFGTADPAGAQTVGELGLVTQRWSELGAASKVSLAVSTTTSALLGIGLAAAVLLLGAVQLAGIPGRREQAATMREAGFTRARIARWYAAEELPALIAVALVGVVAIVFATERSLGVTTSAAALAATAVFSMIAVAAGSRVPTARVRHATSRRRGAATVWGFGLRQVRVHALTALVEGAAIVVVGLAAAGLAAVATAGWTEAGRSSLALLVLGLQLAPQAALALAGIVAGMLLARLIRRIDLARRSPQWATLRAAGWTSRHLAAAQRVEGLVVSLPALAIAAAAGWAGARGLQLDPAWLYAAVAAGGGILAALVSFSARRKGHAL